MSGVNIGGIDKDIKTCQSEIQMLELQKEYTIKALDCRITEWAILKNKLEEMLQSGRQV